MINRHSSKARLFDFIFEGSSERIAAKTSKDEGIEGDHDESKAARAAKTHQKPKMMSVKTSTKLNIPKTTQNIIQRAFSGTVHGTGWRIGEREGREREKASGGRGTGSCYSRIP